MTAPDENGTKNLLQFLGQRAREDVFVSSFSEENIQIPLSLTYCHIHIHIYIPLHIYHIYTIS